MTTSLVLLAGIAIQGNGLTLVPSGMTAKLGGYSPIRAEMKAEGTFNKKPAGIKAPMYGTIDLGGKSFGFILDEPADGPAKLYVDSNGNGDLTDDPVAKWEAQKRGDLTMHQGSAQVMLDGKLVSINAYRFDKNDPQRAALKNTLLYYTDFGYEGKLRFGSEDLKIAFAGAIAPGARIWVDRNGNGKSDGRSESVAVGKPFNFGGHVYNLDVQNGSLKVVDSPESVEEFPLPPDLTVGQPAPKFTAEGIDGKPVNFPQDYKGKVVMLDFWATWCGPCIAELPNVLKAYDKFHGQGFDVLGISFDQPNQTEKVKTFTQEKNMAWRHIYEGKFWDTTLGKMYGVEAIPFVLLVDGNTGKIIATVRDLRGEALDKTLTNVMAQRKAGG